MHLGGFALFIFLVGFNLFMTAWLREWTLFLAGLPFVVSFLLIAWRILMQGNFFALHLWEATVSEPRTELPQSA
jgi:hypothetical protein